MLELGDRGFKSCDTTLPQHRTIWKLFEQIVFSVHSTPSTRVVCSRIRDSGPWGVPHSQWDQATVRHSVKYSLGDCENVLNYAESTVTFAGRYVGRRGKMAFPHQFSMRKSRQVLMGLNSQGKRPLV
jgi:hypothetical protein